MYIPPRFRSGLLFLLLVASVLSIAAGIGTAHSQGDNARRQIDALLGTRDTFVAPEQWKKLGPEAAQILESIATDTTGVPSRRARALEGLTEIRGANATNTLHNLAHNRKEAAIVRMSAIRGLGRSSGIDPCPCAQ